MPVMDGTVRFRWRPRRTLSIGWCLAVVMLCLSGSPGTVEAADSKTLRVLKLRDHEINHPHRNVRHEVRLLNDFAASNGYELKWLEAERPTQLVQALEAGAGDIVIADLFAPRFEFENIAASEPLGAFRYALFGDAGLDITSPLELTGLRVAVAISSPLHDYLSQLRATLRGLHLIVVPANTGRVNGRML